MQSPSTGRRHRSYSDVRGEWEDRKISVVGVVKSFISQLRIGQDLTRVSLPAVYLRPYSILEEAVTRNFMHIDLLFPIPKKEDPLDRLMGVLSWLLSLTKAENFNHKPINPVLGETNMAYYRFGAGEDSTTGAPSTTYYLSEQVSHHPPISCTRIDNPEHKYVCTFYLTTFPPLFCFTFGIINLMYRVHFT